MSHFHRRRFLKATLSGLAGSLVLSAFGASTKEFDFSDDRSLLSSGERTEGYWELVRKQFRFAKGLSYFNNGSLGPSPLMVQTATNNFRKSLDEFPSRYMWGGWNKEKEKVRKMSADLFSVSEEEIALIHNTTEGMNLIAKSMDFKPGDEVILADHEHPSGTIPWMVWQETKGIKLVRPVLPIIPQSIDEIIDIYRKAITPRTRLISMCHIVNTNGMILPVKQISRLAHEKGILVAVDGAQSAGMLDVDLRDLGCDYYAASSHKWLFSPKGVGILYAKHDSQHLLVPLIVSNGYQDTSMRRLENYNTRNLPELLGLGTALEFNKLINSKKIEERSFELKEYFRSKVEESSKFRLKTPSSDQLSAAIQTVEVLDQDVRDVKDRLFNEYGIDTRPMTSHNLNGLRVSLAVYITRSDIDYFVGALENIAGH